MQDNHQQIIISQDCSDWLKKLGKDKIQAFQDSLAELLNISLCILTLDGKSLTVWSNFSLFCHYMLNLNRERCLQERENVIKKVVEEGKIQYFTCYAGLTFFCSPIYAAHNIIAILYGGAVLLKNNPSSSALHKLNTDITIVDENRLNVIIQFIMNVSNLLNVFSEKKESYSDVKNTSVNTTFLNKRLSQRELEILRLINNGESNKGIASKLFISEKTVKTHVSNILKKLGLKDRTQIIIFCKENNFM